MKLSAHLLGEYDTALIDFLKSRLDSRVFITWGENPPNPLEKMQKGEFMRSSCSLRNTVVLLCVLIFAAASAPAGDGALSPKLISEISSSFEMDPHTRAMYNAITSSDINTLALNRDVIQEHNDVFSHKIKARGVTNQKSSGRCWLFAGLNVMRPMIIEKYKLTDFEFSQNYLAFWDKMEKANCFLENIIEFIDRDLLDREMEIVLRNPFADGGWWKYVVDLVEKYGVVPKEVMPETNSSENTRRMNQAVSRMLRCGAVKIRQMYQNGENIEQLRTQKELILADVYKMLCMNLGKPPDDFKYRFEDRDSVVSTMRTYTPLEFYRDFVAVDLKDFVSIFNDPTREFGKHYEISLSRNIYDGADVHYANVDVDDLKEMAMKSVLADEPVWFACDVGKDQDSKHGIMAMGIYDYSSIYNVGMDMSKAERALYRESSPNHAMVFIGVDTANGNPVKWLVENSWGKSKGDGGYWAMYDSWFDNHVYNIVVKKEFVPKDILAIYDTEPIVIPPWDPMYSLFK